MPGFPRGDARNSQGSHLGLLWVWLWSRLTRRMRLCLCIAAGLPVLAGASLFGLFIYYTVAFPDPAMLRKKERAPVIRILARDGSVLAERGAAHDFMPLDFLPDQVVSAVVATEDRRFFQHWGLDFNGLARAAFANLRAGRFSQGGSTITQQLAKNLFLSPERTLARKIEEMVFALWLEVRLSKHDILELYLNRVYFGGGAYGIEAAAQRYFDKSARQLNLAEAALIAGLLKAPSKYSPSVSPGAARQRGRVVLAKMLEASAITAEQHRQASADRIRFADHGSQRDLGGAEYIVELVLEHLPPLLGSGHAEVVVETTLDPALQRTAQAIVQQHLLRGGAALQASQAAVVVLDTDGGIRAMVGGRSFAESQFNRAAKARRQPGSAFKPFVYLAALERGLGPDSIAYDLPVTIEGWSPRNDSGSYKGAMPLRQALAQSVNTIAVRLLLDAGAARVVRTARRLGIRSELSEQPSLALGTSEVTLLELTGAYTPFSNGGMAVDAHAIRRVRISSGRILFAREAPRPQPVVVPHHVAAMNEMLHGVVTGGTGRRAMIPLHPAAGKTGTTQDFRDAWFVGYTSHLVGGVWVGNDNGRAMNKVAGGGLPAEIWHDVMRAAHEGRAPLALPGLAPLVADNAPQRSLGRTTTARALPGQPRAILPPTMPRLPISEEFIARAIAAGPGLPNLAIAVRPDGSPAPATPIAPAARPPGLMSLGGERHTGALRQ